MSTLLHFAVEGEVIASYKCKKQDGSYIILVKVNSEVGHEEWATAMLWPISAGEWFWGHYTTDFETALDDFCARIKLER